MPPCLPEDNFPSPHFYEQHTAQSVTYVLYCTKSREPDVTNRWYQLMKLMTTNSRRRRSRQATLLDDDERVVETVSHFLKTLSESATAYSPGTIRRYGENLRYLCEWLQSDSIYGEMPIDHALAVMPGGVVNQYLVHLQQSGIAPATARNRDITYKIFFKWLTTSEAGKLRESSGYEGGLHTRSTPSTMPRFVTKEEVIALLKGFHHESQRCAMHLIYDAGLRVSEVPRIQKSDIDALDHWPEESAYLPLMIKGSKGHNHGNIKERYALISRAIYERIKKYHSTPRYRFAKYSGPKPAFLNTKRDPLTAKALQKETAAAAKRAGFPLRHISPHRLRHGTALSFLQGTDGQDYLEKLVNIQIQLGHSSVKSTETYSRIPSSLFTKMNGQPEMRERFLEAQDIYDQTYLPIKKHQERRGCSRKCQQ